MAEGYGRYTYSDTRNFFIIARGSVTETMENLATPFDESYITVSGIEEGEEKCELVFKLTNGYISYLDKSNASKNISNKASKFQTPNSK